MKNTVEEKDARAPLELAPEVAFPEDQPKKNVWQKLKRGLLMTHTELIDRMDAALKGRTVLDQETLDFLEESLIAADLGVETSLELVDTVKKDSPPGAAVDLLRLKQLLTDEISIRLLDAPRPVFLGAEPSVTLMIGVNGVGKTTSIAKLTHRLKTDGRSVILAAADTFRAAAIDQLVLWGERLGVDVVRHQPGGDPGAVVFDALQAARARDVDHLLVDTAGRLHTKQNLMAELAKIDRIIEREAGDRQRRTVLVLDATTGHNALTQAKEFSQITQLDGVLLTKLDGTAKGGMAVAIASEMRLPVLYLGVGEKPEDLVEFHPREFAAALFA